MAWQKSAMSRVARVTLVLCIASLNGAAPVQAGGRGHDHATPERVETVEYSGSPTGDVSTDHGLFYERVELPGGPERFVRIEINDQAAPSVAARVAQDDVLARVCGSSPSVVPVQPNHPVTVVLMTGRCSDGTPSAPTQGSVTATFTHKGPPIRTQSEAYSPVFGGAAVRNVTSTSAGISIVTFAGGAERSVAIEVADASGMPVSGTISQGEDDLLEFCGSTPKPVTIAPYERVDVYLFSGPCDGTPTVTTKGTVTATFTRGR